MSRISNYRAPQLQLQLAPKIDFLGRILHIHHYIYTPTLITCTMPWSMLTVLSTWLRNFNIATARLTPYQMVQVIDLLGRLKQACETALPQIRARYEHNAAQRLQRENARVLNAQERTELWTKKTEKSAKVLKISEISRPCEDACCICLENHTKGDMIQCNCKHEFGRACFLLVAATNIPQGISMKCPVCRVPIKTFHGFRRRASPKPRSPA